MLYHIHIEEIVTKWNKFVPPDVAISRIIVSTMLTPVTWSEASLCDRPLVYLLSMNKLSVPLNENTFQTSLIGDVPIAVMWNLPEITLGTVYSNTVKYDNLLSIDSGTFKCWNRPGRATSMNGAGDVIKLNGTPIVLRLVMKIESCQGQPWIS